MTRRHRGSRGRRDAVGSSGERFGSELGRDYGHCLSCGRPTRAPIWWWFQCRHCYRITQVVLATDGGERTSTDGTDADTLDGEATDGGDARNAAAFMGGTDEVEAVPQQEDYEPQRFEPSAGGFGRPTATLPIDQLEAIDPGYK